MASIDITPFYLLDPQQLEPPRAYQRHAAEHFREQDGYWYLQTVWHDELRDLSRAGAIAGTMSSGHHHARVDGPGPHKLLFKRNWPLPAIGQECRPAGLLLENFPMKAWDRFEAMVKDFPHTDLMGALWLAWEGEDHYCRDLKREVAMRILHAFPCTPCFAPLWRFATFD